MPAALTAPPPAAQLQMLARAPPLAHWLPLPPPPQTPAPSWTVSRDAAAADVAAAGGVTGPTSPLHPCRPLSRHDLPR
jgi:hypothetical protein